MNLTIEEKQTIETLLLCKIADVENNMPKKRNMARSTGRTNFILQKHY